MRSSVPPVANEIVFTPTKIAIRKQNLEKVVVGVVFDWLPTTGAHEKI
jgi:hypothetical protein